MQLLPEVLAMQEQTEHKLVLQLQVQADLHFFPNHFAGFPLLPGVVQLNWVMHFGREHLPVTGEFKALENIKFQSIVQPGQLMQLHLQWHAPKLRLEFEFSYGEQKFSSGRIVLMEGP